MRFLNPQNLAEALQFRSEHGSYVVLAGGTDLAVQIETGSVKPSGIINIFGLDELRKISDEKNNIRIGACATHAEIIKNEEVKKHFPALVEACQTIGARQIQNRGTVGGNVMNASPAGDTLPVLLVYDASVEISSMSGVRVIPFGEFYKGYRRTALKKDELVTAFLFPKTKRGTRSGFVKIGTRRAQAISKVMGAFMALVADGTIKDIAIAFGSVAPVPVRLHQTEKYLTGKVLAEDVVSEAIKIAGSEISPIDDIRSTSTYRKHAATVILGRFLSSDL